MDPRKMDDLRLEQEVVRLLNERHEQAQQACAAIRELLGRVPIRIVDGRGRARLEAELPEQTMERLRGLCELVTGIEGHDVEDDDVILGFLALAALRGPLWPAPSASATG